MCVYFRLIYRPDLFNLLSVFLLGIVRTPFRRRRLVPGLRNAGDVSVGD